MKIGYYFKELCLVDFDKAEDFAYQIEIPRGSMHRQENGKAMLVSMLLKIVASLDETPGNFFSKLDPNWNMRC